MLSNPTGPTVLGSGPADELTGLTPSGLRSEKLGMAHQLTPWTAAFVKASKDELRRAPIKQAQAARLVFEFLAARVGEIEKHAHYGAGSEYAHKVVSNLFSRDKKSKDAAAKLSSLLSEEKLRRFRQEMAVVLDDLIAAGVIVHVSRKKEEPVQSLEETQAALDALKIDVA